MSAASLLGAPPGVPDPAAHLDTLLGIGDDLLNRAGKVWRVLLAHFWQGGDFHPTVKQLAELARLSVSSVQRGLKELAGTGRIVVELDQGHPVGRRIAPAVPLPAAPEGGVRTDGGSQFCPVNPDTPYVERKSASALDVTRGGSGSDTPPGRSSEPLTRTLSRLETESDPGAVEAAVSRLVEHFGKGDDGRDYRPFYLKTCRDVAEGRFAIGELIGAVEESGRDGARSPRRAFIASVKARRSGKRRPKPGPTPGATPVAGGGASARVSEPEPVVVIEPEAIVPAPEPAAEPPASVVVVVDPPAAEADVPPPPSDEELRWYTGQLGSGADSMFLFSFRALRLCGREDLLGPHHFDRAARIAARMVADARAGASKQNGRHTLASVTAAPKSPCRPPG